MPVKQQQIVDRAMVKLAQLLAQTADYVFSGGCQKAIYKDLAAEFDTTPEIIHTIISPRIVSAQTALWKDAESKMVAYKGKYHG